MKISAVILVAISLVISVKAWRQKYGNDFVTYSIGDRYERGVFLCFFYSRELYQTRKKYEFFIKCESCEVMKNIIVLVMVLTPRKRA